MDRESGGLDTFCVTWDCYTESPALIPVEMVTMLRRVSGWLLDAQLQMGHLPLHPQGSGNLYCRRQDTKDLRRFGTLSLGHDLAITHLDIQQRDYLLKRGPINISPWRRM